MDAFASVVERSLDPTACSLHHMLSFLQLLLDRNLAFSAAKTYAAGISSCHKGLDDRLVFSHPLMKCFLRSIQRHQQVSHSLAPQWDFALKLRVLVKASFEPFNQVPLKLLSAKMALLLAMASAKGVTP